MNEIYDYLTIQITPRSWPDIFRQISEKSLKRIAEAGGTFFGLFTGQIGMGSNDGILISNWPDTQSAAQHAQLVTGGIKEITSSKNELLKATIKPEMPSTLSGAGIYTHRWFDIRAENWSEFLELSSTAWPHFESAYDAKILGFWQSLAVNPPNMRVLLMVRYKDLTEWERSRKAETPQSEEAWERFRRRHVLTESTVLITTQLANIGV